MNEGEVYSILGIGNNFYYQLCSPETQVIQPFEIPFFKDFQKYHKESVYIFDFNLIR